MNEREQITVVILTLNEAKHIRECIRAARRVADTILISDSFSTDGTPEIAREEGAIVQERAFDNYANQRNAALEQVRTPWVFFVDADERVTPELAQEVLQAVQDPEHAGWWVPRYNYIVGRLIRGGGWYPDYQLRLLRTELARYDPTREVHEVVQLEGKAGYLKEHLIHYNYESWAQFHAKQRRYARLQARVLYKEGIKPHVYTYVTMPVREFWRRYVTLKGFRDGYYGLKLAALMGWYTFVTYRELGRLLRKAEKATTSD